MINKSWLLLLTLAIVCTSAFSQKQYSYMTDRIFKDQLDLYGYVFVPNQMEIQNETQENLKMGDYSFGVMGGNLYVDGKEIKGVYNINNIDPADYGYKLNLMNARDPTIQGHLKIIQTKYGHVDALVFKRSSKEKEMIFFLPAIPKGVKTKERNYFTDRWELPMKDIDEMWGQTIYPFLRIHNDENIQERLQIADSTSVTFIEKITKIEKKKKGKKKKKIEMENIELGIPDEEIEEEVAVIEQPEPELEREPEVAPQPEAGSKAQPSRKRQRFGGYQNTKSYDDTEEEEEEVVSAAKSKPIPKPKKEEKVAADKEQPKNNIASEEMPEEDGKEYKIIKEYFVNLRTILTYDDGAVEDVSKSYPVKKIIEREDNQAGPDDERYQLEINLKKGGPIYLYLTEERTISSIEIDGKTYLMRGH